MGDFDFVEQLINPFMMEKLGEVYQKDKEYQKRLEDENLIYDKLSKELTDKQAEQLEKYFIAVNTTAARKEILTYIQGMKDLLALLKALS